MAATATPVLAFSRLRRLDAMTHPQPPPTEDPRDQDAERACQEMREHLDRAREIMEQYRAILSDTPRGRDRRN